MVKKDINSFLINDFFNAVGVGLGRPIERVLASAVCRLLTPFESKEGS